MSKNKAIEPKTHWRKLYNPNYIGSWVWTDPNEIKNLTIKTVKSEPVTNTDGKTEDCTVIHWEQDYKPLIVNKTNAESIEKALNSPYIEDWTGKTVSLYIKKVKAFGDRVDAIRIKTTAPKSKPELKPNTDKWNAAIKSLNEGNATIPQIEKHYKLTDANRQKLIDSVEL